MKPFNSNLCVLFSGQLVLFLLNPAFGVELFIKAVKYLTSLSKETGQLPEMSLKEVFSKNTEKISPILTAYCNLEISM